MRVSTAYQFFTATKEVSTFTPKKYGTKAKPKFEATNYITLFVAANEDDERGKLDVALTLNRSEMWDCNVLKGSFSCYEFIGMMPYPCGATMIAMRNLPCPCEYCVDCRYELCFNRAIVGEMTFSEMKLKPPVECMEELALPLTQYTVAVLKLFIKNQGDKLPKDLRKPSLIDYVLRNFGELITHVQPVAAI